MQSMKNYMDTELMGTYCWISLWILHTDGQKSKYKHW